MKIFIQIVKEFSIQIAISIVWACYNLQFVPEGSNKLLVWITHFVSSLFLTSWFVGQFLRIRKQLRIEQSFEGVENRLEGLVVQLQNANDEIVNNVIGGDSFVYIQIGQINATNDKGSIIIHHQGKYPTYDTQIRVADINAATSVGMVNSDYISIHLINHPIAYNEMATFLHDPVVELNPLFDLRWNIFYSSRNGSYIQLLRMKFDENKWHRATRVIRNDQIIFEQIANSYPEKDQEKIFID